MDIYSLPTLESDKCYQWHLYKGHGRNLGLTICTQKGYFVGIRRKFQWEFLDTEYYYGPTTGTYRPKEDLGVLTYKAIDLWQNWLDLKTEANEHHTLWYNKWRSWEQPITKEERETFEILRNSLVEKANYDVLKKRAGIAHGRLMTWLKNKARVLQVPL